MFKIETEDKNPFLRKISEKIEKKDFKKYRKLWEKMVKYVKEPKHKSIWLAAPQIKVWKRLIAVWLPNNEEDENYKIIYMINPKILEHSDNKILWEEWCLSVPWYFWEVERYKNLKLEYYDSKWKKYTRKLTNFAARVVQHEIDHLDWILFTDKAINIKKAK